MDAPTTVLPNGTKVITHETLSTVTVPLGRPNAEGTIRGTAPGSCGDAYWIEHADGEIRGYWFKDFELLETNQTLSEDEQRIWGDSFAGRLAQLRAALEALREQNTVLAYAFDAVAVWSAVSAVFSHPVGAARVVWKRYRPQAPESIEATAQALYEAYCLRADWKNYQGLPCPRWDDGAALGDPAATLTEKVRENWRAVARYVIARGFMSGGERPLRTVADLLHNCFAHPLLFWSKDAPWAVWLHDETARIAYPAAETATTPGEI